MLNFLAYFTFALLLVSTVKAGWVSLSTGIGGAVWGRLAGSKYPVIRGFGGLSSLPSGCLGPPGSAERLVPACGGDASGYSLFIQSRAQHHYWRTKLAYKGAILPLYNRVSSSLISVHHCKYAHTSRSVEDCKDCSFWSLRRRKIRLSLGPVGRTCHV